jgi:hypothetical protein
VYYCIVRKIIFYVRETIIKDCKQVNYYWLRINSLHGYTVLISYNINANDHVEGNDEGLRDFIIYLKICWIQNLLTEQTIASRPSKNTEKFAENRKKLYTVCSVLTQYSKLIVHVIKNNTLYI